MKYVFFIILLLNLYFVSPVQALSPSAEERECSNNPLSHWNCSYILCEGEKISRSFFSNSCVKNEDNTYVCNNTPVVKQNCNYISSILNIPNYIVNGLIADVFIKNPELEPYYVPLIVSFPILCLFLAGFLYWKRKK